MDFVIDCESRQIALETISAGFNCSTTTLKDTLLDFDIEKVIEEQITSYDPLTLLYNEVVKRIGPPRKIDGVMWFHCTRTFVDSDFSDGILPLELALPKIWKLLIDLAPTKYDKVQLKSMQETGVPDFQYDFKVNNSPDNSVYAFQVRELAVQRRKGLHDYLEIPEIIEDILNGYNKAYGKRLHDHYIQLLTPKIVKFFSDHKTGEDELEPALGYLYNAVRGDKPDSFSMGFIQLEQTIVKPNQIVKVESNPTSNDF